ncbi:helix-turn-helix domain-containing protein [Mucilaginibacter ginsenosidivorans]|uniref:Helix-turn-helix domain-containing protein n=1 Tax=Mucilaginibacter ginsenosidivorans TaxID=398053 RepID=A0A5B8UYM3_9SPHI|nr:helix-turn-helix transcriptional regulator [Mucilaginibacter ginsenosidivorans]QEC63451.1 helix-turn-helix domain-containing protein [Mucilaginibacter ginsenosidivorans]
MKAAFPVYDICKLSDFQQEDILVSRFGIYLEKHTDLHFPHKHSFYHLVLFTKGGGTHAIDFTTFKVEPYQIYFMVPGQVHSWDFAGDVDGYVVHFSEAFFQSFLLSNDYLQQFSFFSGNAVDQVIDLPDDIRQQVINLFENIVDESENPAYMSVDMIRTLLLQAFILINRKNAVPRQKQPSAYNYTLLKNFRLLIEENFATLRLPKDYAQLLYITPNHLNALCNDMLGMPAGDVIRNRVLLEIKRLLINLDLTVAEIGYRLNFNDNSYFTKFFKKYTGLTPEDFRKNTLKNPKP